VKLGPELTRRVLELARESSQPGEGDHPADEQSEKEFQAEVIKRAMRHGWKTFHVFDARKSEAGWPDLVLVRERVIVRELKVGNEVPTAAQAGWLEAFANAGIDAGVWKPTDWPEIEAALSGSV
jgi:hypothetical protein